MHVITPEIVVQALRSDIAGGRVQPGSPLRQQDLAARFGVSRIPVREALRQLEADGIVVVHANRGAFVRRFTVDELREIFDLRIMLETDLLRRAIRKMRNADLERIGAALETAERQSSSDSLRDADRNFHKALYSPACRPTQMAMVMKLRDSIAHYAPALDHMHRLRDDWMDDHRIIVAACRRGDSAAAVRKLKHHLQVASALTLGNLERDPERAAKT